MILPSYRDRLRSVLWLVGTYVLPALTLALVLGVGAAFPPWADRYAGFAREALIVWLLVLGVGRALALRRPAGRSGRADLLAAVAVLALLGYRCGDSYLDYRQSLDEARALRVELARYQAMLSRLPAVPDPEVSSLLARATQHAKAKARTRHPPPAKRPTVPPPPLQVAPPAPAILPPPVEEAPPAPQDDDTPLANALATARSLIGIVRDYHASVEARYDALGLRDAVSPARLTTPIGLKLARQGAEKALEYTRQDLALYDQAVRRGVVTIQQSRVDPEYKKLLLDKLDDSRELARHRVERLVLVRSRLFERLLVLIAFVEQHPDGLALNHDGTALVFEQRADAEQYRNLTDGLSTLAEEESQLLADARAEQQQGLAMLNQVLKSLPF